MVWAPETSKTHVGANIKRQWPTIWRIYRKGIQFCRKLTDKMLSRTILFSTSFLWVRVANAAFGITTSDDSYVIDAGSANPLKFTVSRSSCDITSINYYGSELQYSGTGSHIGSGLGSADVSAVEDGELTIEQAILYILISCL